MRAETVGTAIFASLVTAAHAEAGAQAELRFELLGAGVVPAHFAGAQERVGGLSGLTYLADRNVWLAASDAKSNATLCELRIELEDAQPGGVGEVRVSIERTIRPEVSAVDAEAVTAYPSADAYVVSFEAPALAWRIDARTLAPTPLPVPPEVTKGGRFNRMFESAAYVTREAGGEVWLATEQALHADGEVATSARGTRARVLFFDAASLALKGQALYETDPAPRGGASFLSLSEMEGLPDGRVLFLERGYDAAAKRTTAKIYVTDGTARTVDDASLPILQKSLAFDLRELGITLANVEAMALGQALSSGGRLFAMIADDGFGTGNFVVSQIILMRMTTLPTSSARPAAAPPG